MKWREDGYSQLQSLPVRALCETRHTVCVSSVASSQSRQVSFLNIFSALYETGPEKSRWGLYLLYSTYHSCVSVSGCSCSHTLALSRAGSLSG